MNKKVMLMILDGWGMAKNPDVSAIDKANTPFVDSLYTTYPNTLVNASGREVGLPIGQMGNSEVGHMNLGAGRVVYQDLVRINMAVEEGKLGENATLKTAFKKAAENNQKVHFLGLVSDGGVHAHINHLKGLIDATQEFGVKNVFIHAFTDGRDTDPHGAKSYLADLESHIANKPVEIASVVGRYFAMDRDKRWERVKKAYDLLVNGKGASFSSASAGIESSYSNNITDEFVEPFFIEKNGQPIATIEEGDLAICFNFRTDRGREISEVLTQRSFHEYNMHPLAIDYITLTPYDDTFKNVKVAFEKENIQHTLGEVLANNRKSQIRIAETEKYPHVTFFFSGGRETPFEGEKRILCPSPKVATYDLQPEMSAFEIRDKIIPELREKTADFICLNFANPDMVGHTGVMEAAIKACETVDQCAKDVVEEGLKNGYSFIVLADHGNADCMINEDGSVNTAHTTQPVPCFFITPEKDSFSVKPGKLGDIAPSILYWMGLTPPEEMSGENLLTYAAE